MTVVVVTDPITILEAGVHPCMILIWAGQWLLHSLAFVHSGTTTPLGSLVAVGVRLHTRGIHTSSDWEMTKSGGSEQLRYHSAVKGTHNGS